MKKIEKAIEIAQLVHNYYHHGLDAADEKELSKWLTLHPQNRRLFDRMLQELETADKQAQAKYEHKIDTALVNVKLAVAQAHKPVYKLYLPYAAAVIVLFLSAMLFQFFYRHDMPLETVTVLGERKELYLPDGTYVSLDPCSKLTYSKTFGKSDRDLILEGAAYFNVAKNEQFPLSVSCKTIKVDVLGTSFRLKAYAHDKQTSVLVTSGKVRVGVKEKYTDTAVLGYGEQLVYRENEQPLKRTYNKKELDKIDAGVFVYDGDRLQDIIGDLERSYGVVINCQQELKNRLFFGDFDSNEKLSTFLDKLTMTVHGKWERINENQYIIQHN